MLASGHFVFSSFYGAFKKLLFSSLLFFFCILTAMFKSHRSVFMKFGEEFTLGIGNSALKMNRV